MYYAKLQSKIFENKGDSTPTNHQQTLFKLIKVNLSNIYRVKSYINSSSMLQMFIRYYADFSLIGLPVNETKTYHYILTNPHKEKRGQELHDAPGEANTKQRIRTKEDQTQEHWHVNTTKKQKKIDLREQQQMTRK